MAVRVNTNVVPWENWEGVDPAGTARLHWKLLFSGERTASDMLSAGLAEIAPGDQLDLHHHRPAEMYFVLEGRGCCTVSDEDHELTPGTALFIPSNAPHVTRNTGSVPLRFLFVFPTNSFDDVGYVFHEPGTG